ncbi:hypothetical protein GQ457_16G022790 [Hibiscus cannabinus]
MVNNEPKSGLRSRIFGGSIRCCPPSDRHGSGVCHSPLLEQAFDRWDSWTEPQVAGDAQAEGFWSLSGCVVEWGELWFGRFDGMVNGGRVECGVV